jgi:hypothetical protein
VTAQILPTIPWIGFIEDALKRSADEGRPVLLDFFSPT